jgi:hypothetical protein
MFKMNNCISFTEPYGRLGNFLFQYAICRSLSLDYNLQLIIPQISNLHLYFKNIQYLNFPKQNIKTISESEFNYNTDLYSRIIKHKNKNILLSGFWQTSKYFNKYSDIIKADLEFINLQNTKNKIQKYYNISKNVVCIHVRKTDYLQFTGFISPSYTDILNSIIYFKSILENPIFLVFSDDYNWCKLHLKNIKNLYFSDFESDDLCAMSLCTHNIISCSSFGWWAAYLNNNPDKIVMSLNRNWFNPYDKILGLKNTIDVLESYWISGVPSLEKIILICDFSEYNVYTHYILNINCEKICINLDTKYSQIYRNIKIVKNINTIQYNSDIWYMYIKFKTDYNYNFLQNIYRFPNTNILYTLSDLDINMFEYKNIVYSDLYIWKGILNPESKNNIKLDDICSLSKSNFIEGIFKYLS